MFSLVCAVWCWWIYIYIKLFLNCRMSNKAISLNDKSIAVKYKSSIQRSTLSKIIFCQGKDYRMSHENLSNLKELFSVWVAEYAVAQGIDYKPAFNWWIKHIFKVREIMLSLGDDKPEIWKELLSMIIKSPRGWRRFLTWTRRRTMPDGQMPLLKRWKMSSWYSSYGQLARSPNWIKIC